MQFNLVNDQEQVAQFVWRGVAWRGVAWRGVAWRSIAGHGVSIRVYCGGVPEAFVVRVFIGPWGACPGRFWTVLAISSSFAY